MRYYGVTVTIDVIIAVVVRNSIARNVLGTSECCENMVCCTDLPEGMSKGRKTKKG